VARDESPNRRFFYAQPTAITVLNLSAVAIFLQKQDTVVSNGYWNTKKNIIFDIFFGGKWLRPINLAP